MSRYKWIAVPEDVHRMLEDMRKHYQLRGKHHVIQMLFRFFESNWQDKAQLDVILREIRKKDKDTDGDTTSEQD